MVKTLCMGAINKSTGKYEYPKIANKLFQYICNDCKKDVILKKGQILQPHFAHKNLGNCYYYDRPTESQIHRDAKDLMKHLLDSRKKIVFTRKCNSTVRSWFCQKDQTILIDNKDTKAFIEHIFQYNNAKKIADIALIENNKIKFIFEICHTHKTNEKDRPEPWFEIKAKDFIESVNLSNCTDDKINIRCIRSFSCKKCDEFKKKKKENSDEYYERCRMYNEDERTKELELKIKQKEEERTKELELKIKQQEEERTKELEKSKLKNLYGKFKSYDQIETKKKQLIHYCVCEISNFTQIKNNTICMNCSLKKSIVHNISNYFK